MFWNKTKIKNHLYRFFVCQNVAQSFSKSGRTIPIGGFFKSRSRSTALCIPQKNDPFIRSRQGFCQTSTCAVFSRRYYQIQRTFDSLSRYRRLIYSDKYGSLVCRALGLCQSKFRALVPLDLLTSTNRINYSLGRSRADRNRNKRDLEHCVCFMNQP